MTPAARVQAAIEILDQYLSGTPAEQALTTWARRSRFAGSKDRAAIRDHVFDALRCLRSYARLGGSRDGRGLMIGACRAKGLDVGDLFNGLGHAPKPLTEKEKQISEIAWQDAERLDLPDWLWPIFSKSLGQEAERVAVELTHRAPVFLRVNTRKATRTKIVAALRDEGIETQPHPSSATCLEVQSGQRKIRNSAAFRDGLVELQDGASQAIVEQLGLDDGMRVLDYCAGGGGKTLAMAAAADVEIHAHDASSQRMRDLPERARRAGINVSLLDTPNVRAKSPFDLVLCDAPCSGSGSWRRSPDGKWSLTEDGFRRILKTQGDILDAAHGLVKSGGVLCYATCSVLKPENEDQVCRFLSEHPGWSLERNYFWRLDDGTDGFFLAILQAPSN
ncbi:MAG: RsmB/NOP family class I SAM-dependent RNA methyltransferase [Rhodobacteraceae bacterium]|nr:RsmB/NOP family class I SAM-dependent RNA methyltransferase [Paracoccaceae bacterium]